MAHDRAHPNYTAIWLWLLLLMALSVVASVIPALRGVAALVMFATAFAKAILVALNFMHLRFEGRLIWAIAIVPVAFFAVLTIALFPDFVLGR
jgi:caa(3)-type oxidase subunit IV